MKPVDMSSKIAAHQTRPGLVTGPNHGRITLTTETHEEADGKDSFQRESEDILHENEERLRLIKQENGKSFNETMRKRLHELEVLYFDLNDRLLSYSDDGSEGMTASRDEYRRDLEEFRQGVQKLAEEQEGSQ